MTDTDLYISRIALVEEMLFAFDLVVSITVRIDNHPEGNEEWQTFRAELYGIAAKGTKKHYQSNGWRDGKGNPVSSSGGIGKFLDDALRGHLQLRYGAELYDPSTAKFPPAKALGSSWYQRFTSWISRKAA